MSVDANQIARLAFEALKGGQTSLAQVLFAVIACEIEGTTDDLHDHIKPFSRARIKAIDAAAAANCMIRPSRN